MLARAIKQFVYREQFLINVGPQYDMDIDYKYILLYRRIGTSVKRKYQKNTNFIQLSRPLFMGLSAAFSYGETNTIPDTLEEIAY